MRTAFAHLLPLTDSETENLWAQATLTVDANVLLDLYRILPDGRAALLEVMGAFQSRLWLSHQAAAEFVRNHARVRNTVTKEAADADADLKKLADAARKTADDLRKRRPLPPEIAQALTTDIEAAIQRARQAIDQTRSRQTSLEAVLEEVLSLFDGCVGEAPPAGELKELHKEAERRIKELVPPGFEDAKKEGTSPHGDYLIWHQVLQYAKKSGKPMIFVTSERKEDWWDRVHGKTVGPRQELLEEAHRVAGQRIVIYQTDSFVAHASKRAGAPVAALLLNDIRSARADQELKDIVESAVETLANDMVEEDTLVNSRIAETNATGWSVDQVDVIHLGPLDYQTCAASFTAYAYYSGDQDEERPFHGGKLTAEIRGTIAFEDGDWVVTEHEVVRADIDGSADEDDR